MPQKRRIKGHLAEYRKAKENPVTTMRDWTGSTIQTDALSVPCRYCLAREGQPCVSKSTGKPITAFPAHTCRINDSQKAGA